MYSSFLKRFLFLLSLSGIVNPVMFGQKSLLKDTLRLPEFSVRPAYNPDNYGIKKVRIDSVYLLPLTGANLSTLLLQHSDVFIKSYGNGTLASPSFRGTSAQHTQIQWNGITLNSPMLGQVDCSQVPVSQFDAIEIFYGSSGLSRGSGAFGGIVDLVTKPDWTNRFSLLLSQQAGSFHTSNTNVNLLAGNDKFQAHLKFNSSLSKNDFQYTNDQGQKVKQTNAGYTQTGISQEMFWRVTGNQVLSARLWYSEDHRDLPPTTNSIELQHLDDKSVKGVLEYKTVEKKWIFDARSMFNDDFMIYTNESLKDQSVHHATSWINKIYADFHINNRLKLKGGIDYTFDNVNSSNYLATTAKRDTWSLYGEAMYDIYSFHTSLVIREEINNGNTTIPAVSIGFSYMPVNNKWSVNLLAARNFRFPSLNDLYWSVGGNPTLKPETDNSVEAGFTFHQGKETGSFFMEFNLTGYYSRIHDMITWLPDEQNPVIWVPENVDEILARGIESGLNFREQLHLFRFSGILNYHFCKSTYEKAGSLNDDKLGKQQIYIPVHTLNATLSVEYSDCFLKYNLQYTSSRYTGKDNLSMMPGYSLSNIILGRNFTMCKNVLTLQLDINNLFNLDYQTLPSRPMPGINWMVSARFTITEKKN